LNLALNQVDSGSNKREEV